MQKKETMKTYFFVALCMTSITHGQQPGCSICGKGKMVANTDVMIQFPGQASVACGSLEQVARMGIISTDQCDLLQDMIDVCGCTPADTSVDEELSKDPTRFPTPDPSPKPTTQPTSRDDIPSPSPSMAPSEMPFLTRAPTPPTLPFTRRPRCGESWQDANHHCYDFCESDRDCFAINRKKPFCYRDLPNVCRVKTLMRCGVDWFDANTRCTQACTKEGEAFQCPWGQKCYGDVADICQARCGYTWDDANKKCDNPCRTLDKQDCPSGQACFKDMVKDCSGAMGWGWHMAMGITIAGMTLVLV